MPTMLNVHEAKANFSGILTEVENKLTVITIMRYGRPVAKIVPIVPKRNMAPSDFVRYVRPHLVGYW